MTIKHSVLCLTLLSPLLCNSQTIRVDKIKDDKAIIEIIDGSVKPGETYQLGSAGSTLGKTTPRKNLFAISGGFSNISQSSSSVTNTYSVFSLTTKYGVNKVDYEYGGLLSIDHYSSSGVSATGFQGGGFFDYNLVPNKSSSTNVYGIGTEISGGTVQSLVSANKAVSTYRIFGGGFLKYFPFNTSTAIRMDLGFNYRNYSESPTITESGLMGIFGMAHYF